MNCTSVVHKIPGLKPRQLKELQRPKKDIPGLGTLEYAREERCHSWQLSHRFVPSRVTLVDEVLADQEEVAKSVELFAALVRKERRIRERAVRARYFEFVDPEFRDPPIEDIIDHLDDWAAPYRINRWAGASWELCYDCTDAPHQQLLHAPQFHVMSIRIGPFPTSATLQRVSPTS